MSVLAADTSIPQSSNPSYVEWGAVFGGAVVALSVSIVLLTFGAAVGLSAVSPFTSTLTGVKAAAYGSAFWSLLVAVWSLALGGYLAGRMRHKFGESTEDEMKFRDAAHGLLAWGVFVIVLAGLSSAGLSSLGRGVAAFAQAPAGTEPAVIATDTLLRGAKPGPNSIEMRQEIGRLIARSAREGEVSTADKTYLASVVAANTGIAPAEAEKRVDDALNDLKTTVDHLRKVGIVFGFWMAATLLVGGVTSFLAAELGGKHREEGTHWEGFAWTPWEKKAAQSHRLYLDLTREQLREVDEFRFSRRLSSRSEALRALVVQSLAEAGKHQKSTERGPASPPKVISLPNDAPDRDET